MNIITFIVYADDKRRARRGLWRTSESTLVLLAVAGGSVGAVLAMLLLRHKTRHTRFVIGIPTILVVQILIAFFMLG
ncbi:MAG: DUF1294 domain-containing protein [Muribaculaceae bacterium]|nr:DUF1294 domain-containing protein [Muribaculaceae bacterium]